MKFLTCKPTEKRPLGRPRRRWEDNIRKDLKEIGVGLSGLGVTSSPRDPKFAGSNPGEVDEFFQDVKILSTSPDFRLVKNLEPERIGL